ncbi:unnamed protein product [Paramecium sonneborni]|uniref:Uncharacterized protein n=1 Tax=Paramecium sonneborni TaxID=65129 RepID=A0A8S1RMZ0_9CILI|nr:unnamed protein product [Paramecium sonneborni]
MLLNQEIKQQLFVLTWVLPFLHIQREILIQSIIQNITKFWMDPEIIFGFDIKQQIIVGIELLNIQDLLIKQLERQIQLISSNKLKITIINQHQKYSLVLKIEGFFKNEIYQENKFPLNLNF